MDCSDSTPGLAYDSIVLDAFLSGNQIHAFASETKTKNNNSRSTSNLNSS